MPHVVILYTADLEAAADMGRYCRAAADALLAVRDEAQQAVFPIAGVRVFAYPAAHSAVADGSGEHGFIYVQARMARGRSLAVQRATGEALATATRSHFAPLLAQRKLGITVQVDEGHEVFDIKLGNLHPIFNKA